MKTNRLLTTMLLMAATFCASEAMAQIPANYVELDEVIYQTTGKNLTLYALPDLVFSPSYSANGTINPQSQWRWEKVDGHVGKTAWSSTSNTLKDWTALENYVTVSGTADFTVLVKERYGDAGCEPADAQIKQIKIVGAPECTGINVSATGFNPTGNTNEYQICANPTVPVEFRLAVDEANAAANMNKYGINLAVKSETMDNSGAWIVHTANESTLEASNDPAPLTNFFDNGVISISHLALVMKQSSGKDLPTKYTFTFAANSLRTQTSVLSDYRANPASPTYSEYTSPLTTFSFIIAPAPTTGPIYHIPNSFTGF